MSERLGRSLVALLGGHLCCLAGFELCRLWAFFPGSFRVGASAVLVLAYLSSFVVWGQSSEERSLPGALLLVWASVMGYVLLVSPLYRASALVLFGVLALGTLFRGRRLVLGLLAVAALATLAWLQVAGVTWPGLLLAVLLSLELHLTERVNYSWSILAPPDELQPGETRAEISWGGFAQLYSSCAAGEGEKFSRQVLKDTVEVIEGCGGIRESGSEHRGTYKFPSYASRRDCHRLLLEYQEQLDGVLDSVQAPQVRVFFKEL